MQDFEPEGHKRQEEGEYSEKEEALKSISNEEAPHCKKSTDTVSNRGAELDDLGMKEEDFESDFDSPYHGDDKFCLDLLGI